MRARIVAFAALFLSFAAAAQEASPGPVGSETGPDREQLHWVPYPAPPAQRQALLFMRVCRPPGAGPHKLAVINHGSPPVADHRPTMEPIGCAHEAARWFLERGFAIAVPMRRGYGRTGGRWMENYGTCAEPDFHRAGLTSANDVQAAVAYARALPFARKDAVVVVGQSAGGWATVALSSRNPDVAALINFAGGRAGRQNNRPNNNCAPAKLIEAAGRFGATARLPMLWIYTPNDSYLAPEITKPMHDAYVRAGGLARFAFMPEFGSDGHFLFGGRGGSRIWGPVVETYLAERGLN
jgi:dienelactone hydrolase